MIEEGARGRKVDMTVRLRTIAAPLVAFAALSFAGCEGPVEPDGTDGTDTGSGTESRLAACDASAYDLGIAADWDAIRAIDDPHFVSLDEIPPDRHSPRERVIGLIVGGAAYAIPHRAISAHEIVNFDTAEGSLAITYCPITGSALAFDRAPVNDVRMGVSGLLLHGNLIMFDRRDRFVLWSQMAASSLCGPREGTRLPQRPVIEMHWESWIQLHPDTRVLQVEGPSAGSPPSPTDPSPTYERRVLGAPSSTRDSGIAFRFQDLLDRPGSRQAISFTWEGEEYVLLWSDEAAGGMAFLPRTEAGIDVGLIATETGFRDERTGSVVTLDGRIVDGPLDGSRLRSLTRAYVAFEGAWTEFHPDSRFW